MYRGAADKKNRKVFMYCQATLDFRRSSSPISLAPASFEEGLTMSEEELKDKLER
ncbi:hypothetical protein RO3G_02130 [Rhizopus delemar RA 99-880]|uniref:Uncharacterized protein n=1 Tax=Rhizopus delemar (strain RA 99-880 / ATCC MYA-4621 / FGSC 9543 / NRRL 43880) TaxID=246409 RepID=I1BMJ6_RHIO9|nr:hypothetical protein RO3G_02130 [Rhizopus delemar RA 99-880]|eukprot:EIE77426.1 hypothetical protein RO3G_02130 [Rhizopus delemar RA 99-880]